LAVKLRKALFAAFMVLKTTIHIHRAVTSTKSRLFRAFSMSIVCVFAFTISAKTSEPFKLCDNEIGHLSSVISLLLDNSRDLRSERVMQHISTIEHLVVSTQCPEGFDLQQHLTNHHYLKRFSESGSMRIEGIPYLGVEFRNQTTLVSLIWLPSLGKFSREKPMIRHIKTSSD
jgi:hypothetical protein